MDTNTSPLTSIGDVFHTAYDQPDDAMDFTGYNNVNLNQASSEIDLNGESVVLNRATHGVQPQGLPSFNHVHANVAAEGVSGLANSNQRLVINETTPGVQPQGGLASFNYAHASPATEGMGGLANSNQRQRTVLAFRGPVFHHVNASASIATASNLTNNNQQPQVVPVPGVHTREPPSFDDARLALDGGSNLARNFEQPPAASIAARPAAAAQPGLPNEPDLDNLSGASSTYPMVKLCGKIDITRFLHPGWQPNNFDKGELNSIFNC